MNQPSASPPATVQNSLLFDNSHIMFIAKAYSPNSGHFKHVPDNKLVSNTSLGEPSCKERLDSQKRISSHVETQEKHSETQEERSWECKHLSQHSADLSVYSPIELDDNDIDENNPSMDSILCSRCFPTHDVEELNANDDKEDVQNPVLSSTASAHR